MARHDSWQRPEARLAGETLNLQEHGQVGEQVSTQTGWQQQEERGHVWTRGGQASVISDTPNTPPTSSQQGWDGTSLRVPVQRQGLRALEPRRLGSWGLRPSGGTHLISEAPQTATART